jgi:hypothetical protein
MRHYPEVPDWWYLIVGALFFGLAMVTVLVSRPWSMSSICLAAQLAGEHFIRTALVCSTGCSCPARPQFAHLVPAFDLSYPGQCFVRLTLRVLLGLAYRHALVGNAIFATIAGNIYRACSLRVCDDGPGGWNQFGCGNYSWDLDCWKAAA